MRLAKLLILASLTYSPAAMAQSATTAPSAAAAETDAEATATAFLRDVRAGYDRAATEQYVNDHAGRLVIYREALARMDAAPATVRADPRYARAHLFYEAAVATTLPDAGDIAGGRAEVARLIPDVRRAFDASPNDGVLTDILLRLLRVDGQLSQADGNLQKALTIFREAITLNQRLIEGGAAGEPDYALRSLAIDLDNLANMEAQVGNQAEANQASRRALDLFRDLAERAPNSRPAQGSLLIAQVRRAINFSEIEQLDAAERQIAVMRQRGMLTGQYAQIAGLLPQLRAEIRARRR